MLNKPIIKSILTIGIAVVWSINGLFCKLLNFVPRHQLIVSRIVGEEYASIITKVIGVSEMLMFVWIISKIKPRLCAITQILVIATMNILEFILVPDLLLFGKLNIVLAAVLIVAIFINEFLLPKSHHKTTQ